MSHVGLVTRGLAFAVDAAIINVVAVVVGVAIGLIVSVLKLPDELDPILVAIAALAYFLWSAGYFVTFWSTTGQTPGNRLFRIRVCRASDGLTLRPRAALGRLVLLVLCAIPLFAGFVPILTDDRRRGVHDMFVGSVVIEVEVDRAPPAHMTRP